MKHKNYSKNDAWHHCRVKRGEKIKMKDTWINFRSDQNTKERFEKLVLTTHKNKQELMNDLIDSYLLLNNDEYNSLDKKISYMLELLNIINEYVQLPIKSYCKELPKDMTEIEKIVKAKSRYHLAIMNKINMASLPTR